MALDPALKSQLDTLTRENKVVLFMKGNRRMPRCGFSATVVGILDGMLDSYETVDVLSDPAVRQGIKDYSDWPTIPQLYIDGEFQGGCDIVKEMAGSGELHKALGVELQEVETPEITVTPAAAEALTAALEGATEALRFGVSANYRYDLQLGAAMFGDVTVEAGGVTFLLDRASAQRAGGTVIDYVKSTMGEGFQITNPNEPAKVQQIRPKQAKELIDSTEGLQFFDVRSAAERATATLGATLFEPALLADLDRATPVLFHCHHGGRSQKAAEAALQMGFTTVYNLAGGIEAWSREVDPSVPRY